jgi:hypothetical protein
MTKEQKSKKPDSTYKKNQAESFWLNQPGFFVLQKELPEELLKRFYYNILKEEKSQGLSFSSSSNS